MRRSIAAAVTTAALVTMLLLGSASMALAGDMLRERDHDRDRLKDGSCKTVVACEQTRDQIRTQARACRG
ncbi:MAG: hypothetical protein Q8S43_11455 [Actinomycetota bacterium]|nr:MAG: hypothetical protein FD171_1298 [Actinomycetota bacterium]MDO8949824.1 hypothetical protein [Actinomycetota bacterium]MDP3631550.1 hypothetical protein [Actinomycetota bacterium]